MAYCYNFYSPVIKERAMTAIPYGTSPYYQAQPTTPGTTTPMTLPTPSEVQVPQTVQNPYYLAGKLKSYIGKDVRVEFLIGTNGPLVDRLGTLLEVGASYIIIRPIRTDDTLICDFYSIKFVTVYG